MKCRATEILNFKAVYQLNPVHILLNQISISLFLSKQEDIYDSDFQCLSSLISFLPNQSELTTKQKYNKKKLPKYTLAKRRYLILRSGLAFERALKLCGLVWSEHREKREQRSDKNETKNVIYNY